MGLKQKSAIQGLNNNPVQCPDQKAVTAWENYSALVRTVVKNNFNGGELDISFCPYERQWCLKASCPIYPDQLPDAMKYPTRIEIHNHSMHPEGTKVEDLIEAANQMYDALVARRRMLLATFAAPAPASK